MPQPDTRSEMKLPEGQTCGDCAHIRRCQGQGFTLPENTRCDFHPTRFRPAGAATLEGPCPVALAEAARADDLALHGDLI